jgi:glyoxylase-like metal-dependent hydrolase (beta-lactamase superfamily II)
MIKVPTQQIPGFYHRRIGDIVVTAISDGYVDAPMTVAHGLPPAEAEQILTDACRPLIPRISVNCFAVYSAGRLGLIETGSGNTMGPTLGFMPQNLKAAGIDIADIDTVLLTHVHPDHSNGLTDAAGVARFPMAEIVVNGNEVDHWHNDAAMAKANERQRVRYFQAARTQLAPYHNRLRRITSGEVFPGVTAVPIPGHTPGHTAYMIASGSESLLIWGDIVHIPDIQVPRPEVTMEFDSDPEKAAATRMRVFDMTATDRILIGGMHLHFPGFSHLVRAEEGYRLLPEPWSFQI